MRLGEPRHAFGGREAGERRDATGWETVDGWQVTADLPNLLQVPYDADDLRAALHQGSVAQPVERALPRGLGHGDQRVEAIALLRGQLGGEGTEQVVGGATADAGDATLEHG